MAATLANGVVVKLGSTTITELTSVGGPSFSADAIDATTHSSADSYREFIQGLRDGGEISLEGNFTTATSTAIVTQFNTTATVTVTIDLPTKPSVSRFTASVICTGFETTAPSDDKIGFNATFKVTGKPTLGQV